MSASASVQCESRGRVVGEGVERKYTYVMYIGCHVKWESSAAELHRVSFVPLSFEHLNPKH